MSEIEQEEVVADEVEEIDETETDTTDWKSEALKARGIAKRNATRLEKLRKAAETKVETVQQKKVNTKEFDYAEKAYLKANGIERAEFDLVQEVMTSTGKSLDEVLEAKYFQAELKERRDLKASKDAIPSGSKRSGASSRNEVDYWIAKGEMPPADQRELRSAVLQERMKREKINNQFSSNPIV